MRSALSPPAAFDCSQARPSHRPSRESTSSYTRLVTRTCRRSEAIEISDTVPTDTPRYFTDEPTSSPVTDSSK